MSTWSYFRDVVRIGPNLKQYLDAEIARDRIPQGSTINLGGRIVEHEPEFVLSVPSYHLVITAGTYDCAGGWIDTSVVVKSSDGPRGPNGTDADVVVRSTELEVKDSTPGATGGRGNPGGNVTSVVLICRELKAAQIRAKGGAGGHGGDGGDGGSGAWGCLRGHGPNDPEPICEILDAAPGGNGGQGGSGGSGGRVLVIHVSGPQAIVEVSGGPGGSSGQGGQGGLNNRPRPPFTRAPSGSRGSDGQPGTNGIAAHAEVTDDDLWLRMKEHLGAAASEWAAYRLNASEYNFRIYNRRTDALNLALTETSAVLNLTADSAITARAQVYRQAILNNQNIVFIERDLTLIPDFERYRQVVVDYADVVQAMFYQGDTLLLEGMRAENILRMLELRQAHLIEALQANGKLDLERLAADAGKQRAELEAKALEQRLTQVQVRIGLLEKDLQQNPPTAGISLDTGILLGFAVVASVALIVAG